MKTATTLILLTILFSCKQSDKANKAISIFTKPFIIQPSTKDSLSYKDIDFVNDFSPLFIGKYKYCDTLFISDKRYRETNYHNDFFDESLFGYLDSIMTDGFELFPDYNSTVYRNEYDSKFAHYYYPVYLVNQTPSTKSFMGKDSYIFGLQEAIDTNGRWRPIEARGYDFCGVGYWGLKVHSQEFVTILFQKYSGSYKTKIRVRIKNGDNIYVSKPYDGTINEKQLYIKKDSYLYREMSYNKSRTIQDLFYGAEPFGSYDEVFGLQAIWKD